MMAAEAVFLDTGGWIALLNRSDDYHERAAETWERVLRDRLPIVLTDWIIAETGNGLARTAARDSFAIAVRRLTMSPRVELVRVGDELRERALGLYDAHADKQWGLIDCASFIAMRDRSAKSALTADRHFTQAGFEVLL